MTMQQMPSWRPGSNPAWIQRNNKYNNQPFAGRQCLDLWMPGQRRWSSGRAWIQGNKKYNNQPFSGRQYPDLITPGQRWWSSGRNRIQGHNNIQQWMCRDPRIQHYKKYNKPGRTHSNQILPPRPNSYLCHGHAHNNQIYLPSRVHIHDAAVHTRTIK